MEFINVTINKKLYEKLKYLSEQRKKEIKQRKNAGTIYPIYIVQDQHERIINTEFEDGGTEVIYAYNMNKLTKFYEKEEVIKYIEKEIEDEELKEDILIKLKDKYITLDEISIILEKNEIFDCANQLFVDIEYEDKAYFLTKEEAEDYIKRQYYNLKDPKIYVNFPGYSNYSSFEEILNLLDNENIFVETIFLDELNVQSQHDYLEEKYSQLSDNKLKPIYLCAICDNEITSDESGICSGCREHEEYKRGEYENRERIIIK